MEDPLSNLRVGYGWAKGDEALLVGREAAKAALAPLGSEPPVAVLVFASIRYDLEALLHGIHEVTGAAPVLGATTAGEICNGPQQESVVVVALASPYLTVKVGVGKNVSQDWQKAVAQAVGGPGISQFFNPQEDNVWRELTRQGKSVFGIIFSPGNTRTSDSRSFEILEELKRLSVGRIPLIGGAAADGWRMEANSVLWGRQASPDSVLLAVFETQLRFGIAMAHGFGPTSRRAAVTRSSNHTVLELDGKPAAKRYAHLLCVSPLVLEGKHLTLTTKRPVGVPYGRDQYQLNAASYFTAEQGVRFSQPIPEGSMLTLMEADRQEMVAAGAKAVRKALMRGDIKDPALTLMCSCALRHHILEDTDAEEITCIQRMLPQAQVVGFYSFGEQGVDDDGVNRHNNLAISILILSRELSYAALVAQENLQLAQDLSNTKDYIEDIFNNSADPIGIVDAQGRIVRWNKVAEEIFGYTPEEISGQSFRVFYADSAALNKMLRVLRRQRYVRNYEIDMKRKDGSIFPVSLSIGLLRTGSMAVVRDQTETKACLEAAQQLNARLQLMLSEVEQCNRETNIINSMAEQLQSCLSCPEAYTIIAQYVQDLFPARSGALFLKDASQNLVEAVLTWGEPLQGELVFPSQECWALRRERLNWHGGNRVELSCGHVAAMQSGGYFCLPLQSQDGMQGLLHLQEPSDAFGDRAEPLKRLAITAADHISISLSNIKLRESLRYQVIHDPLTDLFNRRYLEETLVREILRVRRKGAPLAVIMLDLDHFKRFNDTFGHEAGDNLLRTTGKFLKSNLRQEDMACRYGGEEMVMVLPETPMEVAMKRAEEIREGVAALQIFQRGQSLQGTTVSLGVAMFPEHGVTGEDLLKAADDAMYQAKAAGRNRVMLAESMRSQAPQ